MIRLLFNCEMLNSDKLAKFEKKTQRNEEQHRSFEMFIFNKFELHIFHLYFNS